MVGARPRLQQLLAMGYPAISDGALVARSGVRPGDRRFQTAYVAKKLTYLPSATLNPARVAAKQPQVRFTSPCPLRCTWRMLNLPRDLKNQLIMSGIETNPGPSDIENSKELRLAHININSITAGTKRDELENFVDVNNIKILGLSETKLDDQIHPSLYKLKAFHTPLIRHRNRHGGGVALYFHTSLAMTRLPDLEVGEQEWIWAKTNLKNMTVITCCLYLPPKQRAERLEEFLENFTESVFRAQKYNPSVIIIIGDFNAGNVYLEKTPTSHSPITNFEKQLKETAESLSLTQLINEPTRYEGNIANLRDLCLVSDSNNIIECGLLSSFSTIDHFPIYVTLKGPTVENLERYKVIWDYSRLDPQRLTHELMTTDWDDILDNDIDTATELFTSAVAQAAENCIPKKTVVHRLQDKPWISREVKCLIRKRDRLFRIARKRQNEIGDDSLNKKQWHKWRKCRNNVTTMIQKLKSHYFIREGNLLAETSHGPHKYHSTIRKMIGKTKNSHIPPLQHDGKLIDDDMAKANLFNKYFASQSQLEDSEFKTPPQKQECILVPKLQRPKITGQEVLNTINRLNPNKSTGPDQIPVKIIKLVALIIADPLSKLFNKSIETGRFPQTWKVANVKPIFKNKGSPAEVEGYRPISLLSCMSKIFEKIIFKRIYEHITSHNLLTERQSGYRPGHGTQLQLFYLTHTLYSNLDKGHDQNIIYLDISRYFEKNMA